MTLKQNLTATCVVPGGGQSRTLAARDVPTLLSLRVPKPRPQCSPSPRTQSHFPPNPKHTQESPGCSTNCPTSARAAGSNPTRPGFTRAGGTGSDRMLLCPPADRRLLPSWGRGLGGVPARAPHRPRAGTGLTNLDRLCSRVQTPVLGHSPCGLKSLWSFFPHERPAGPVMATHKRERVHGTLRGT